MIVFDVIDAMHECVYPLWNESEQRNPAAWSRSDLFRSLLFFSFVAFPFCVSALLTLSGHSPTPRRSSTVVVLGIPFGCLAV